MFEASYMPFDEFRMAYGEFLDGISLSQEALNPTIFRYLYPFMTLEISVNNPC